MNVEDMVFGRRYRVIEKIGSGGMADVYKAVDEVLGRTVAVKVLDSRYASDPTFAARFRQEAQAAANLQSPYVVNIYDWGREGETYYIVMELVRGTDLKTSIQQRGAIDSKRTAEIGAQVCSALSVAHGYDVIHRDVKPHNIMLTGDGSVKVMDFGIARAGNTSMTQTGSVLGTAHYVSPEQAQGRPLSPASDLYSLGIVLYELTTGQLPFDGDTPVAVALKQVNETPLRPSEVASDIDPSLEAVIMKAMAKSPTERYDTADEMRRDLLNVIDGRTVAAAPVPMAAPAQSDASKTAVMPAVGGGGYDDAAPMSTRRVPPRKKRKIWPWVILAILLVAAGLGAAWSMGLFEVEDVVVPGAIPDVVGQSRQAAESAIRDAGFEVGEVTEEHSDEPENTVISQSPEGGEEAEPETEVDLVISLGPAPVIVPTLIGMTEAEAQEALEAVGLVARPLPSEFSRQFDAGRIMRQSPDAGTEVPRGSAVQYTASRGVEVSEVPNVVGMSRADAQTELNNAGFRVSVSEANSPDVAAGNVISQNPNAGIRAEENSTVAIVVSRGPQRIEVPNLIGMTEAEARAALTAIGLRISVSYEFVQNSGTVITQDPAPRQQVERNAVINVTVDDGDEP
jgi:eukaryotic-like serine/threonine-protein kinase